MEQSWITEIAMLMEQSSIDPSPKPVRGMTPVTRDFSNSNYLNPLAIDDGSPMTRGLANTSQQTFSSEQEEEKVISKTKVALMIQNMLDNLTPADRNAEFLLSTLKTQILNPKA